LYADQRSLQTTPWIVSPNNACNPAKFRREWITKHVTVAVAAAQSQHFRPACSQLVSSTFLAAAACTACRASSWGIAKAILISCSRATTVPSETGTWKTVSTISSTPRLPSWWQPLK
jgi:hypothetical protein